MKQRVHSYSRSLFGMLGVWYAGDDPTHKLAVWRYLWGVALAGNKVPHRRQRYVDAVRTIATTPLLQSYGNLWGLQTMYALGSAGYDNGIFSGIVLDDLLAPSPGGKQPLTWPVVCVSAGL